MPDLMKRIEALEVESARWRQHAHRLTLALLGWQGWAARGDVRLCLRISAAARAGLEECMERTKEVLGG